MLSTETWPSAAIEALYDAEEGIGTGEQLLRDAMQSGQSGRIAIAKAVCAAGSNWALDTPAVLQHAGTALILLKGRGGKYRRFQAAALHSLACAQTRSFQFKAAAANFTRTQELATELGDHALHHRIDINLGNLLRLQGEPTEALAHLLRCADQAEASATGLAHCHLFCSLIYEDHGYWDRAIEHLGKALELGGEQLAVHVRALLARLLVGRNRTTEARQTLLAVVDTPANVDSTPMFAHFLLVDALVCIAEGQVGRGQSLINQALALTDRRLGRELVLRSQCLAELELARELPEAALARATAALQDAHSLASVRVLVEIQVRACESLGLWRQVLQHQEYLLSHVVAQQATLHSLNSLGQQIHTEGRSSDRVRALRVRTAELQQLRVERDELIEIVANDLQSPLTTLTLATEVLSSEPAPPVVDRSVSWATKAIERISSITSKLELVAALEGDPLPAKEFDTDIDEAVRRSTARSQSAADSKSIDVELVIEDQGLTSTIDPEDLDLIVDNLIANAIMFGDPNGSVRVHVAASQRKALIVVVNTGQGWEDHETKLLFQKYIRLSSRPTGSEATSGLGLYIAQQLATRNGGQITGWSDGLNTGASFTLAVPLAPPTFTSEQADRPIDTSSVK